MIIDGKEIQLKQRIRFQTHNSYDYNTYTGVVIAMGGYEMGILAENDIDNYHREVLKTQSTLDADPKNYEYFLLKLPDGKYFACAREWVVSATFSILDLSSDTFFVVRGLNDDNEINQFINKLISEGYNVSLYTP
jgi:hypothetical protein